MKLVIVTAVGEIEKDVLTLFKKVNIEAFSSADMDGHKNAPSLLTVSS